MIQKTKMTCILLGFSFYANDVGGLNNAILECWTKQNDLLLRIFHPVRKMGRQPHRMAFDDRLWSSRWVSGIGHD